MYRIERTTTAGTEVIETGFATITDAIDRADQLDPDSSLGCRAEAVTCSCPPIPAGWWDCTECPLHGEEAAAAGDAETASEQYAENAWLRAAEYDPRMHDPREW